jgi:hypothetical protein
LPFFDEELVLNQQGKRKVDETQHKHGEDISSCDIPAQRIFENIATCKEMIKLGKLIVNFQPLTNQPLILHLS